LAIRSFAAAGIGAYLELFRGGPPRTTDPEMPFEPADTVHMDAGWFEWLDPGTREDPPAPWGYELISVKRAGLYAAVFSVTADDDDDVELAGVEAYGGPPDYTTPPGEIITLQSLARGGGVGSAIYPSACITMPAQPLPAGALYEPGVFRAANVSVMSFYVVRLGHNT